MKFIQKVTSLSVALLLSTAALPSFATSFNFSYTFNTGQVVTGSFDGTAAGNLITGLSNISAAMDGVPLPGLTAYVYTAPGTQCGTCWAPGGAVVSTDPLLNNFLFTNATTPNASNSTTNFYVIPWPNGGQTMAAQVQLNGTFTNFFNGNYVPANWSVTVVPEPSTWAFMLLGLGVLGAVRAKRARLSSQPV